MTAGWSWIGLIAGEIDERIRWRIVERELTCIVCPRGCCIRAVIEDGVVLSVTGNSCPKGEAYAREELVAPQRMLTTTVRITGGTHRLLPVVSRGRLPKSLVPEAVCSLKKLTLVAPIVIGTTVMKNILGTGVDVVAGRSCDVMR